MSSLPEFAAPGAPPRHDGRPVVVLASGRQRVAARLLDFVIAAMVLMAPQLVLMGAVLRVDTYRMPDGLMITVVTATIVAMIWFWILLRIVRLVLWGCTVGQRIAGIRVVRMDDLRFPGWKQAFGRWAPVWGTWNDSGLGPWSDWFAYLRDKETRRCLHDRAANTVVVRAQRDEPAHRFALALTVPLGMAGLALGFLLIT